MSTLLIVLLPLRASAGELDRLEEPLRTGLKSPADAAVVIGAEDYLRVADVPFARNDARIVYDWLVYSRGLRPSSVQLIDHEATRETMQAAIVAAADAVGDGGRLWVYFAGHGAASPETGERLWLGDDVSATPASFQSRGLPVASVHEAAAKAGVDAVIVSDACFSGQGRGGEDLAAGARFVVPNAALPAPTHGIVEWDATSTTEIAGPLPGADHGAFTWFFVGALRGWADGETDGTRDGNVTLDEAELYVSHALRTVQVNAQRPVLMASDSGSSVLAVAKEEGPDLATLRRVVAGATADSGTGAGTRAEAPAARPSPEPASPEPGGGAAAAKPNGWEVAAAILTGISAPLGAEAGDVGEPLEFAEPRADTTAFAGRWGAVGGGADFYVLGSLDGEVLIDSGNGCISLLEPTQAGGPYRAKEEILAGECTPWDAVELLPGDKKLVVAWQLNGERGVVNLAPKEAAAERAPSGSWTGYFYRVGQIEKVPATLSFSSDSGAIDYLQNDCDTRLSGLPEEGGARTWLEAVKPDCTAGVIGVRPLSPGSALVSWAPPDDRPAYWGILHNK